MVNRRLAISLLVFLLAWLYTPATAEIQPFSSNDEGAAQAAYMNCIAAIHRATKADQLPTFSHSSPINKIKLVDTGYEEKEMLSALKDMTPHTVSLEGKSQLGDRLYFFYEGNPELAQKNKEYFPVTVEMVKEDGAWRLRRQQSWHVKNGSPEAAIIPKGKDRVRRFQDLAAALSRPIPQKMAYGTIAGKPFRVHEVEYNGRDGYFRLVFKDGDTKFGVYVREPVNFAELQNQHFTIDPLDGMECDLNPPKMILMPYCAKISFGQVNHDMLPGAISLSVRTPIEVNLQGVFFAHLEEDALTPDAEQDTSH